MYLRKRTTAKSPKERGITLVAATIAMLAFILATGMAIDVSHLYLAGTELQNAADAAALAAAHSLNATASGITDAVDQATASVNKFEFNKSIAAISRANVRFATNFSQFNTNNGLNEAEAKASPQNIRFVKVIVPPQAIKMFFVSSVVGNMVNLSRSAVAGQSVGLNKVCNFSYQVVFQDDVGHGNLDRVDTSCGSNWEFTPGCTYRLHGASNDKPAPGVYMVLNRNSIIFGGPMSCWIGWYFEDCITTGTTLPIKPGDHDGKIEEGINYRFDVGGKSDKFPSDTNIKENITYAQYGSGDAAYKQAPVSGHQAWDMRRVLVMPIINMSNGWNATTMDVTISKFGAFFVKKKANSAGDLEVEFVKGVISRGQDTFDPTAGSGSPQIGTAVLYQ